MGSKIKIKFIGLLGFLAFLGCATPYGPEGTMGGYRDYPIGENRHHIRVLGNNWCTVGTVEEYF